MIVVHGERHGCRTPNVRERSRAMLMEAYLTELGLAERVLYDAQGKSFDPQAVEIRIADGIRQWSIGEGPPRHAYVPPSQGQNVFQTIYDYARAKGLPAVGSPFPYDLRREMFADRDGTDPTFSDTPGGDREGGRNPTTVAAGNGREER